MNIRSCGPVLTTLLAAALAPAALSAQLSCSPVNALLDGGFERAAGSPPACPDWAGTSTHFGSPVCSTAVCGSAAGIAPRTGVFWALFVGMDGNSVASYLEPSVPETTYTARSVIVDAYADGLPHTLQFEYVKGVNGNAANFSLDDVALTEVHCQALLLDGFETHDSTNWSTTVP